MAVKGEVVCKKAKDWTMPKDLLLLKIEHLGQNPNIYAEEIFTHSYEPISKLLCDINYVNLYAKEAFADLISIESEP